jgi:hypothetical protein
MEGRGTTTGSGRRWWVYDRPLVTDWLFAWAVAISVAVTAWPSVSSAVPQSTRLVDLAVRFGWALVATSIVLGCAREYVRGHRDGRPAKVDGSRGGVAR